jgi:outer membrane protein assembly factor BamC
MKRCKWSGMLTVVLVSLALGGCGSFSSIGSKKIDYKSAGTLPPLEVPPDLTAPGTDDRFAVPDIAPNGTATFSAYSKEREGKPTAGATDLLPTQDKVTLERAGSERWLTVNEPPEKVWPVVKEFWQEMGFIINVERPEAGIMETDWAENRAKIPMDPIRSVLGKVVDSLYSTAERDKFRTRLERGKSGDTEIYISHRGMYEVIKGGDGGETTVWEPRPADPELEAEMLRRLMVRFGVQDVRAKALLASDDVEKRADLVKTADGTMVLALNDQFDRAWRRVGLALDRVGFTVEDRDRSSGLYYVRYVDPELDAAKDEKPGFLSKLAFWHNNADNKDQQIQYRIKVAEENGVTRIRVLTKDGSIDKSDTGRKILNLLYEQLK